MPKKSQLRRRLIKFMLCLCLGVFSLLSVSTYKARSRLVHVTQVDSTLSSTEATVPNSSIPYHVPTAINETYNLTSSEQKIVHLPTIINKQDVNPLIIKHVTLKPGEKRDPFVNLHSYNFSLNSDACRSNRKFLAVLVHSAPGYYKKRHLIRATFGSVHRYKGLDIAVVFLLGRVEKKEVQDAVREESELYGDIVQGNFLDSYRSLVTKHIMAMHWYMSNCVSDYILKLDDDSFINPYRLVDALTSDKPSGRFLWCQSAVGYIPFRDPKSKYHTPVSQYPFKRLPQFCLGFAYITTPDTWKLLYTVSESTRLMNMDDVFVGILALRARVKIFDLGDILLPCKRRRIALDELKTRAIVFDPMNQCGNRAFKYWKQIQTVETR